jgi:hypothetical protein
MEAELEEDDDEVGAFIRNGFFTIGMQCNTSWRRTTKKCGEPLNP